MWQMLDHLISLIFRLEIPHDELINVVYSFCSDLLLFSRKFAKIVRDANRAEYQHNWELRPWKLRKQICCSSFWVFVWEVVGKLFWPKTRIFHLILNLRCMFKNHQYLMVLKSNFGALFQDTFFLCGIAPNHLRLVSWLVEMLFFSRI